MSQLAALVLVPLINAKSVVFLNKGAAFSEFMNVALETNWIVLDFLPFSDTAGPGRD